MEDSSEQLETQMSALVTMTRTHLKSALVNAAAMDFMQV